MAQVNPQDLLAAAMASNSAGATTGTPADSGALAGAGAPTGLGTPSSDALPSTSAPAAPTGASAAGADTGGAMNSAALSNILGTGSALGQDQDAVTQMVQLLQDPSTPPDQKAQIQMRLQLAALASLAQNPTGSPSAQAAGA